MPLSTFEKILPWTGAVAGVAWVAQDALKRTSTQDDPGTASSGVIDDHLALNVGSLACLVVMGVALLFFAASVRNVLRSAEAGEATYSSVAYGGWLIVAAGVAQMTVWGNGMLSAADLHDDASLHTLDLVGFFGWAAMSIGLSAAFVATGLGGLRNAVLPRWFAVVTVVLGVLAGLGAAHVPPGGLVNYVALPFWLVGASIVVARRQKTAARPSVPTAAL